MRQLYERDAPLEHTLLQFEGEIQHCLGSNLYPHQRKRMTNDIDQNRPADHLTHRQTQLSVMAAKAATQASHMLHSYNDTITTVPETFIQGKFNNWFAWVAAFAAMTKRGRE